MKSSGDRSAPGVPEPVRSGRRCGLIVDEILDRKGRHIYEVSPDWPVSKAVALLAAWNVGTILVTDFHGALLGIISERDIIRGMSEHADAVLALPADRLMTRDVETCSSEDQLIDIMEVMTRQRIRHLPVIQNGTLDGIVSIGDVVKQRLEEVQSEAEELRRYIRSP